MSGVKEYNHLEEQRSCTSSLIKLLFDPRQESFFTIKDYHDEVEHLASSERNDRPEDVTGVVVGRSNFL